MNRRSMLKYAGTISCLSVIWPFLPTLARSAPVSGAFRRVRPSDQDWPDTASWEELNRKAGGRLITVLPLFAACGQMTATPVCQDLLKQLQNPYYVGEQPAGTQTAGWIDAWTSVPSAYAVAAKTRADVVAAVNFAREKKLRLVVKGGGHSYQGTSDAADSLLIWTASK